MTIQFLGDLLVLDMSVDTVVAVGVVAIAYIVYKAYRNGVR